MEDYVWLEYVSDAKSGYYELTEGRVYKSKKPLERYYETINDALLIRRYRTCLFKEIDIEEEIKKHTPASTPGKKARYTDNVGDDWIDECARTLTPAEFDGAMKFTIGKYVRRAGKKDSLESEVGKVADYANRWLEVIESREKEK